MNVNTFRETGNYNSINCWPTDWEKIGETLQVMFCIRYQKVMVIPNASHSMLVKYRG